MKRNLIVIALILLSTVILFAQPYAQTIFFSEYVEGSSYNKALEIFNGTGAPVDLSQYTIKLASNGQTWSTSNYLTPTAILQHNDVFVIAHPQASAAILSVADVTSNVVNYNGNDCVGLFLGTTLIDIIGIYQNDPGTNSGWNVAGVPAATLNHTLIRKPTVIQGNTDWTISAGTNADDSEWIVHPQDYITDLGMHTFTPGGGDITAPPVFNPAGGIYTSPVTVTITCATPNASIYYTLDGSVPTPSSTLYTAPITISVTTTLKAIAIAPGMSNSSVTTAIYTFPLTVPNLNTLRSQPADGVTVYQVTGEVILTFQQSFRNQKYVQDDDAGILIDDNNGVITTTYNIGDGITGLTGKISEYGGMLQFVPVINAGPATSTNNLIVPIIVTYQQLIDDFDTFESRVVKVLSVNFTNPSGNFANGTVYPTSDPTASYNIRTTFYDVDYINTPIPTTTKDITGIPNSRTEGDYFTPRSLSDFSDPAGPVAAPVFSHPSGYYWESFFLTITCSTPNANIYYTLDGSTPNLNSTLYTAPLTISSTTTVKAIAYISPAEYSAVTSATYTFPVMVNNLAALRQSPLNGLYRLTGEVLVTFTQSYRHQKFVQDSTAGILIDDNNGIITTVYQIGDGINHLMGTLTEFGGMLELVPVVDPGTPSSTGNTITPIDIDILQFLDDFETYESRLVRISGIRFFEPTGTFANGLAYLLIDATGDNTAFFRTTFYDVDYIGLPVYSYLLNIVGIPNSRTDGNYYTARYKADFQISEPLPPLVFTHTILTPSALEITVGFETEANVVLPEGLTGYKIYRDNEVVHTAPASMMITWQDISIPLGTHIYYATALYGNVESDTTSSFTFIVSGIDDNPPLTPHTYLGQNYPNPFNPSTEIHFSLAEPGKVIIDIYNQKGELVRNLLNGNCTAGTNKVFWDGLDNEGKIVSSGVYYYRMRNGAYSSTRKMLLLK